MQATELLLEQIKWVHWWIESTIMNTVTTEQVHWYPQGTLVNTIGGNYAHLLVFEDLIINDILKGGVPMYASSWAGKTGMSTLPPLPNPENPGMPSFQEWSTQVDIDLDAFRSYARATFAATEEYFASVSDEQLHKTGDLTSFDLGIQDISWILSIIVGHVFDHGGEIACLKGLQGMQGYRN